MRKLVLVIPILIGICGIHAQTNAFIGNWVLRKHVVFDSILSTHINIYHGEMYRCIRFNPDGTLLVFDTNKEYKGNWSIKGKWFSMSYMHERGGEGHATNNLDASTGILRIMENISDLYTNYDSNRNNVDPKNADIEMESEGFLGDSYYYKYTDSVSQSLNTSQAEFFYSKGIEEVTKNPQDVSAITDFEHANALQPYFYGWAYYWIAKLSPPYTEKASKSLYYALQLMPGNSAVHLELAARNMQEGKEGEALNSLNWCVLLEPGNDSIRLVRDKVLNSVIHSRKQYGMTYSRLEDTLMAARLYLKACEMLKTCDDCSRLQPIFRKINKLRPYYYWEAYYWINDYHSFKKYNAVSTIQNLDISLSINAAHAESYFARASAKSDQEDYLGAVDDMNMAILLQPDNGYYYSYRSRILAEELNLFEPAIRDLTTSIDLDSSNWEAYRTRGTYYYFIGSFEKACDDFKKVKKAGYYLNETLYRQCGN